VGAGFFSPERAAIHSSQCGHQLPLLFADCASQSSAVFACAGPA